ncbi:MAG: class I SAM-dependent methyltransferase [Chitinivibrionales bacterium]
MKNWVYDEFKHCGVDYAEQANAKSYDRQHQKFRDYEKEFYQVLEFICLQGTKDLSVIDLGCGTGAFCLYAARVFKKVYGIDVSEVMIGQARRKVARENLSNITFIHAGFLGYRHEDSPVDLVITKWALHHLPDFWKQIALSRINGMLKPGGALYISDVVYNFDEKKYRSKIDDFVAGFESRVSKEFRQEAETHIREEYSTCGWILEGILQRAGFLIEKTQTHDEFTTEYHCVKTRDVECEE